MPSFCQCFHLVGMKCTENEDQEALLTVGLARRPFNARVWWGNKWRINRIVFVNGQERLLSRTQTH